MSKFWSNARTEVFIVNDWIEYDRNADLSQKDVFLTTSCEQTCQYFTLGFLTIFEY